MDILIIGAGNVGGAIGRVFRMFGHKVEFYDKFPSMKTEKLENEGFKVWYEWSDVEGSRYDIIFICLPTPSVKNSLKLPSSSDIKIDSWKGWKQDLSAIKEVCRLLSSYIYHSDVIVLKSTVLPGTTRNVVKPILDESQKAYHLVYNPEFLTEENALYDFMNDIIVLGLNWKEFAGVPFELSDLYSSFHGEQFVVDWETAEFIKYCNNLRLASMISFWNEIYLITQKFNEKHKTNIDSQKIADILYHDKRLGFYGLIHQKAWWGDCIEKSEFVFKKEPYGLKVLTVAELFRLQQYEPLEILSFDLKENKTKFVKVLGIWKFKKPILEVKTAKGFSVRVSRRHPFIVWNNGFDVKLAEELNCQNKLISIHPNNLSTTPIENIVERGESEVYGLETENGLFITTHGLLVHNCFPKDTVAFLNFAKEIGWKPKLIKNTWEINEILRRSKAVRDIWMTEKEYRRIIGVEE